MTQSRSVLVSLSLGVLLPLAVALTPDPVSEGCLIIQYVTVPVIR